MTGSEIKVSTNKNAVQTWKTLLLIIFFESYLVPTVVLSVAVGSGSGLVVSLALNSSLQILNKDPEEGFIKKNVKTLNAKTSFQDVLIIEVLIKWKYMLHLEWLTHTPCHSAAGWCTPYQGTWRAHGCPHQCRWSTAQRYRGSRNRPADGAKAKHLSLFSFFSYEI